MSEAERVLRDSRQGSLKQSGGHRERELRDRWAELLLGDSSCGDVATELADIAEGLQEYDSDMVVTDDQVQESYRRFCGKNPQLLEPEEIVVPATVESKNLCESFPQTIQENCCSGGHTCSGAGAIYGTGIRFQSVSNTGRMDGICPSYRYGFLWAGLYGGE